MPLDNVLLYLINQFYKLTPISYIMKYKHPTSNNKMIMQSVTCVYEITIPITVYDVTLILGNLLNLDKILLRYKTIL